MRTAGIIAEYNPFHKGHMYHIEETRRRTACQYVVVCMSGAFTQRGEPALTDKWTRARMALRGGADIVLELPCLFAMRSADWFALGGVGLMASLDVVDCLSFGCETEDLPMLKFAAQTFEDEPPELTRAIRRRLQEGQSHARARGEALAEYLRIPPEALNAPNTALAIEYVRANDRLLKPMRLCGIRRTGDYHSKELDEFASAGAIRAAIREGRKDEALACMPEPASALLRDYPDAQLADPAMLDNPLLYKLRGESPARLREICDVSEGLEDRLRRVAQTASDRAGLLAGLKCKRYTMARLSRICASALLDMDAELAGMFPSPPYARLLGFRESARPLLHEISERSRIPLVSDVTRLRDNPCFQLERRATDLWSLCTLDPETRRAGRDFTERMIVIRD